MVGVSRWITTYRDTLMSANRPTCYLKMDSTILPVIGTLVRPLPVSYALRASLRRHQRRQAQRWAVPAR